MLNNKMFRSLDKAKKKKEKEAKANKRKEQEKAKKNSDCEGGNWMKNRVNNCKFLGTRTLSRRGENVMAPRALVVIVLVCIFLSV